MRLVGAVVAGVSAALLFVAAPALGATQTFLLADHPDAARNPPPYGLRLDNVFLNAGLTSTTGKNVGGATTFSFSHPTSAVFMDVTETPAMGGGMDISLHIHGTTYGGVDTGSATGFGEGNYFLDFTYSVNVAQLGTGWQVTPQSPSNQGTLTAGTGITDVAAGTVFNLFEQTPTGNPFKFVQDGHRLGSFPAIDALNPWVGRGWLTFNSSGANATGTQDFLFIGKPIPLPASLTLAGAGLVAMATSRRRRRFA